MTRPRSLVLGALGILASYALAEGTLALGLYVLRTLRPDEFVHAFVDSHFDTLDEGDRTSFALHAYDRELGWDNRPGSEYRFRNSIGEEYLVRYAADGSRADSLPETPLLMHTYGDSYTWCDEVGDDDTWQYFLEKRLGREVKNFGVGAYGTDQAVLKFRAHLEADRVAPITLLGIMEENVNRTVNSFRPFYSPESGLVLGFKPSLRAVDAKRVEDLENPYADASASLHDLRLLAHQVAGRDLWARYGRIEYRYPFTLQALRATAFRIDRKLRSLAGEPTDVGEMLDLWTRDEGLSIMGFLVDEFVTRAARAGSRPGILFIPRPPNLRDGRSAKYAEFANDLRKRYRDLLVIDLMQHRFDRERFNVAPYRGHASAYGNRVIAQVIEEALSEGTPSP